MCLSVKKCIFVARTVGIHYGQRHHLHQSRACREGRCRETIKCLVEGYQRTNKWLAEQFGKDPATVSKWCTNSSQPPLETLMQIARVLGVTADDLLRLEELPAISEQ